MKGQTASGLVLILLGFALVVRTLRGQTTKRIRDLIGGNDFTTPKTGRENTTPGQPNTGPGGGGNFPARATRVA